MEDDMRFVQLAKEQHSEASTSGDVAAGFIALGVAGFFVLGSGYVGLAGFGVCALLAAVRLKEASGSFSCPNCQTRYTDPYDHKCGFKRCPVCYVLLNDSL